MNNERITVSENYMDDRGDSDLEKQIVKLKERIKDLELQVFELTKKIGLWH